MTLHLTDNDVLTIIDLIKNTDLTFSLIAKRFGITADAISNINTGKAHARIRVNNNLGFGKFRSRR